MSQPLPNDPNPLDQPLPSDVSVQLSGWLSAAKNYPVFSPTWYRLRTRSMLLIALAVDALVLTVISSGVADWRTVAIVGFASVLGLATLISVGPGIAVWVRGRGWPASKELAGIVFAMLLGAALAWGSISAARLVGKRVLMGDAHVMMQFQVSGSVTFPDSPSNKAEPKPAVKANEQSPAKRWFAETMGTATETFFIVLLGGGFDLLTYLRQRRTLADAMQRQALERAQAARRDAELKLSVLAAQIEPHFLFNTLAGVRSAIVSDPPRAVIMVDHLVSYLRATIPRLRSDGGSSLGRLDAQLEAVDAYLGLMRARIPRLSYHIDVDPALGSAGVPPMTLISLVENAVKHGIEPKLGPGCVTVAAQRIDVGAVPTLAITVCDDGVGFGGTTSGSGIGLSNIRERLQALCANQARLTLTARAEGGVCAALQIPIHSLEAPIPCPVH